MRTGKKDDAEPARLDALASSLLKSSSASASDIDEALHPGSFMQLKARIRAEESSGSEVTGALFAFLRSARIAVPGMALLAGIAIGAFMMSGSASTQDTDTMGAALLPIQQRQTPVSACSISSSSECVISNEEVLATMMASNGESQQ